MSNLQLTLLNIHTLLRDEAVAFCNECLPLILIKLSDLSINFSIVIIDDLYKDENNSLTNISIEEITDIIKYNLSIDCTENNKEAENKIVISFFDDDSNYFHYFGKIFTRPTYLNTILKTNFIEIKNNKIITFNNLISPYYGVTGFTYQYKKMITYVLSNIRNNAIVNDESFENIVTCNICFFSNEKFEEILNIFIFNFMQYDYDKSPIKGCNAFDKILNDTITDVWGSVIF
jgi:hypothetical protein